MKKTFITIIALLLTFAFLLSGCASGLAAVTTEDNTTSESEKKTEPAGNEETKEETKKTEEEKEEKESKEDNIMQKEDPAKDDTLNILMIGNSFCTFHPDELYGLAKASGIKIRVCSVYYSGCTIKQHWAWLQENNNPYKFYTVEDDSGRKAVSSMTLKKCLQQHNWDIISFQTPTSGTLGIDAKDEAKLNATIESAMPSSKGLVNYVKTQFPQSKLYWHETWAFEVGYNRSNGKVENAEQQENHHLVTRAINRAISTELGIPTVPTGEAWALARKNPVIGDTLCVGTDKGNGAGDHYHDGDLGGGQYLNACVWFEVLMGKSCIGNSFRPNYTLSEEKIEALQEAAHKAVADLYGANFAK